MNERNPACVWCGDRHAVRNVTHEQYRHPLCWRCRDRLDAALQGDEDTRAMLKGLPAIAKRRRQISRPDTNTERKK